MEWVSVATAVLAIALTLGGALLVLAAYLRREEAFPELGWVLSASIVLNAIGITWGTFNWATIEVAPPDVMGGLATAFSHGWFDAYPPFHFELMALATSPILILDWLGRLNASAGDWLVRMLIMYRGVSVIMAAGILISLYLSGRFAFGRRAGLFAAAMFALVAPFVYYASSRTSTSPISSGSACRSSSTSGPSRRAHHRFHVVCGDRSVRDLHERSAYGLYAFTPLVVLWEQRRARGRTVRGWIDAILNRQIGAAILVAAIVFAIGDGVITNFDGFVKHVQLITGHSVLFRVFEPTLAGRWSLLRLTIDLTQQAWGWPFFVACLAGLALAAADARGRRFLVWLLVPVVGYYLTFINVILYNYDRFMLPACLVLALFGGLALIASRGRAQRESGGWPRSASHSPTGCCTAARWILDAARLALRRRALVRGPARSRRRDWHERDPGLPAAPSASGRIPTILELRAERPAYFILDVDYTRGVRPDTPDGQLISGLERHELGYALVYRARTPSPWPWLPGAHHDLVGPRLEPMTFSMLRNLNPTIEVFQRESPQ